MLDLGGGRWGWYYVTTDSVMDTRPIIVTATDSEAASSFVTFDLVVDTDPLLITAASPLVQVDEGDIATNLGSYDPPATGTLTLSASVGVVTDLGNGDWDWSFTTMTFPGDSQIVTITADYSSGAFATINFLLAVNDLPPEIAVSDLDATVRAGGLATNSGTYVSFGTGPIVLSSSVGQIIDNGDGTWSWSYLTDDELDDSQTVIVTIDDGSQSAVSTTFLLIDLPGIEQVIVGDGSLQRSIVNQLKVFFDSPVDVDSGIDAFVVERSTGPMSLVETMWTSELVDGRSVVTITFAGTMAEPGTGSLIDGEYKLTIDGAHIRRAGTNTLLDADGDVEEGGQFVFGAQAVDAFFRLFGDVDGDRDVDMVDRQALLLTVGSVAPNPAYDWRFDVDGDGDVDLVDRIRFYSNYVRNLVPRYAIPAAARF